MNDRMKMSWVALSFVAIGAVGASAQGDPRPGLLDVLSVDRIGRTIAHSAIAALRTQVQIDYDLLTTDVMRGQIAITGVRVRPLLEYDFDSACEIVADRAVLSSDWMHGAPDVTAVTLSLTGARAGAACFPPQAAMGLRATGIRTVDLDQFRLRLGYRYATGQTTADLSVALNDFATLDMVASGAVLPSPWEGDKQNPPTLRVDDAVVSLSDQGGWEKVSRLLPPDMNTPQALAGIAGDMLTNALQRQSGTPLSDPERAFVDELTAQVDRFVAAPGEITLEAQLPPEGVVIAPQVYNKGPLALVAPLNVSVGSAPARRSEIPQRGLLQAIRTPNAATPQERVEVARALLDGNGVPRAPSVVPGLLSDLIDDPEVGAAAALLTAQALEETDPAGAYALALEAGAAGAPDAVALLDRLETRLTTGQVLDAQQTVQSDLDDGALPAVDPDSTDPRALRRVALLYLAGRTAPRSYAQAYRYALLADAAGDLGAASLTQEIAARFAGRGDAAAAVWADVKAGVEAEALSAWIEGGLAERYRRD